MVVVLVSCSGDQKQVLNKEGFANEQLESGISLNIPTENFEKITVKRNNALEIGHHFKSKKDYVTASLSCVDKSVKVKMRLKGDELDHLSGKHWSYKLKGKKNLAFGQKKIVIQSPQTKKFLLEYLFHRLCKQEGIVSLEYMFLPVTINDTLKSTYALASSVGSQTLKNAGRLVGPILKLSEREYWKRLVAGERKIDSLFSLSTPIKACNGKWAKKNKEAYIESVAILNKYRKGELPAEKVFDYDLFARYVAISELLGSSHNLRWLNLRLYFHPKTKKFEPIAFDCYDEADPRNEFIWYNEKKRFEYLLHPLLDDLRFQEKVETYLKLYCKQDFVKAIFSDNHNEISKYMRLIRRDKSNYVLSRNQMLKRAKYILSTLNSDLD
jgi:hypothetical protein